MSGYIDEFDKHRVRLQEALSLHTASVLNDLVSRLFKIKPDWEKMLATKTQDLGDRSKWIDDDAALEFVVSAAEDSVLGGIVTKKVESKSKEMRDVQSTGLSELRDELKLSLDELCNRNMDTFKLKLDWQTQQLENAIERSTKVIVQELRSGPHDRLLHEVCSFAAGFVYCSRTVLSGSARIMEGNGEFGAELKVRSFNTC